MDRTSRRSLKKLRRLFVFANAAWRPTENDDKKVSTLC
jgi:hypothetical protein